MKTTSTKTTKTPILILAFFLIGFNGKAQENSIFISGNSKSLAGDTIYLKKYEHFDFLDSEYIIDSCIVDKNGDFKFGVQDRKEALVMVSRYRSEPPTYQVFKKTPDRYYTTMCQNFFAMEPTVYLEGEKNYKIDHWDLNLSDNSIIFSEDKQNLMRNFYQTLDFRGQVSDNNRKPLDISREDAWNKIRSYRDEKLETMELLQDLPIQSFKHYLKTEIMLGAVNEFLIWYGVQTDGDIDNEFYEGLMEHYHITEWNPNSVQYFKLTERYVSYRLNLENGTNEIYFEPSKKKVEIAELYAGKNIRSRYVSNIRKLLATELKAETK